MSEFELKFEVPESSLAKLVEQMRAKKAQTQLLQACYFDTQDQLLAKHGVVLRIRKEDEQWVQTIKGLTNNALERLEHNRTIDCLPSEIPKAMPDIDLSQKLPKNIKQLLKSILKKNALKINLAQLASTLMPVYETDVQRLKFTLEYSGSLIEIALDQGMVEGNGRSIALCELEIELKLGQPEHAVAVAREWRSQYGLYLSTISKSMKGQRLHAGPHNASSESQFNPQALIIRSPKLKQPNVKSPKNACELVTTVFKSCINQILINASELAIYTDAKPEQSAEMIRQQIEYNHQLRVGIRRLRVAMREFKALVNGIDVAWEEALIEVFRALGKRRDADHLIYELQPLLIANGSPDIDARSIYAALLNDHNAGHVGLILRSEKFQETLLGLISFVNSQNLAAQSNNIDIEIEKSAQPENTETVLAKRLNHWLKKSVNKSKNFVDLTHDEQHSVRKNFKKLRYLAEFSALIYTNSAKAGKRTKAFNASLKPVQDALGFYNDELVALESYRTLAVKEPQAWFAAGWLSARRKNNAKKCQQAIAIFIKKISQKKLFWQIN